MTRQILIDNIVRQTTILIAQLATSGGIRSPLAQIADRVFLDLARELDAQGISRTVSADMFGMALRSYRRRIRQLSESSTEHGRSLWEAVLAYLSHGTVVTRDEVLKRFHRDEDVLVKGVLNDLCESGLVFRLGAGKGVAYRAATPDELLSLQDRTEGLVELVWMLVYREGPIALDELGRRAGLKEEVLARCLAELVEAGRVELGAAGYQSPTLVLPVGASAGWEAAVFDHYQAVVKTLCTRLRRANEEGGDTQSGGSTYSFTIWPGHPYEDEVRGSLREFRAQNSDLRARIEAYNQSNRAPARFDRVTVYGGMCVVSEETSDAETDDHDE